MRGKKRVILLSMAFLLLLAFSPVAVAEETRRVLSFIEWGLRVRVYAPYQAYPGNRITVRVRVTALEDLDDITVDIYIFGSKSDEEGRVGYDYWDYHISVLDLYDLDEGKSRDEYYRVRIPSDSDPGLVYGHIECTWTTRTDLEDHTYSTPLEKPFPITYVKNEAYEELQVEYADLSDKYDTLLADYNDLVSRFDSLQTSYNSLKNEYDSLRASYDSLSSDYVSLKSSYDSLESEHNTLVSDYSTLQKKYTSLDSDYNSLLADYNALESEYETSVGELGTSRNLMYVFVVTTVVFIATSIVLLVRKPKVA